MKKNEYDFSVPTRQSYVAIISILWRSVSLIFRQLLPIFVVLVIGKGGQSNSYILISAILISVLASIYAIINYYRTYFFLSEKELMLYTGVFTTKKVSIPFEKIQSINFEQTLLLRIFDVVKLKIDTAGSDKQEFDFHALQKEKAVHLRNIILSVKSNEKVKSSSYEIDESLTVETQPTYITLLHLDMVQLFKVGITQNHLKSGMLILVFFLWMYENLKDIGLDLDKYSDNFDGLGFNTRLLMTLFLVFLVISIIISLIQTIIKNYDLVFSRGQKGFKIVRGFFTQTEVSAMDHKIQYIAWNDNLLKRILKIFDLTLFQATSAELDIKKQISVLGCTNHQIQDVSHALYKYSIGKPLYQFEKIQPQYFIRFSIIISILGCLIFIGLSYVQSYQIAMVVALLVLYLVGSRYLRFKKFGYRSDGNILHIKGGLFGNKNIVLPIFKIQSVSISQSPYQRRKHLADLHIFLAAGSIKIPYVTFKTAQNLMDSFVYIVESDKRKWM
ncbi:MAG: PH domain-containing protein [Saprospiraceae bacterium]